MMKNLFLIPTFSLTLAFLINLVACQKDSPTEAENSGNTWLEPTENVNGTLTQIEGIPLLTLWGSSYEQGYAHGYLYAPEIIEYLEKQLIQEEGLVDFFETVMLPNIDKYDVPVEYLQEMQGFLAGMEARAGDEVYVAAVDRILTLNDLIVSTCLDNIDHLLTTHCTSFSAGDELTVGGTITGRNYDHPDNEIYTGRYIFIVRKSPPGTATPAWIGVALPGALNCETAMNSEGVTFATQEVNLIRSTSATDGFCPETLLQRKLLESARAASVVADVSTVLQNLYTNGGEALLMSWPSGHGSCSAVFEVDGDLTTGHGFTVRQPEDGLPYMIQTNQFYERLEPEQSNRYDLIQAHLDSIIAGQAPPLTVDKAWQLLGQVPSSPELLIQHAVVFEPDNMLLHVGFAQTGTHATSRPRLTIDVAQLLN
ncbi:MAG: hypothetical protein JSW54_11610 [Fidelibacterota bacterium]|nr:MAG: hypothetical protein JSW54_11610 [Candidatus Neomarinimicrobiota bacterium]